MIIKVNGKQIPLTEFPTDFIKNTICGMLKSLKGIFGISLVFFTWVPAHGHISKPSISTILSFVINFGNKSRWALCWSTLFSKLDLSSL